jgi:hypothetical protein
MKKILLLLFLTSILQLGYCQITRPLSLVNESSIKTDKEEKDKPIDKSTLIPYFAISGLGSISSTSDQIKNVDPAANIGCNISLQKYRAWTFYLNYNIGTNIDTTSKDSLSLPGIFFPDKSKSGFTAGLSFDIFRIFNLCYKKDSGIPTLRNVRKIDDSDSKFYYYTLEPYFEYSYTRRTLKQDSSIIIPRIETSTEILGLKLTGNIVLDKNSFAIALNPYLKFVNITDATFNTYNGLFLTKNNNVQLPHSVRFLGLNINLQINKTILGFTYEDLLNKKIFDNNVWGGVFTLKAVIAADFFNF